MKRFFASLISLIFILGISNFASSYSPGASASNKLPLVMQNSVRPLIADSSDNETSSTNILIDGNDDDWNQSSILCQGSSNISNLSAVMDSDTLFLLVRGTNLDSGTSNTFFIDSDNNPATGYQYWKNCGADYIIDSPGELFKYTGSGDDWKWADVKPLTFVHNNTITETSVSLSDIGSPSERIKVSHYWKSDYKVYTPLRAYPMSDVLPRRIFPSIPYAVGMALDDAGWQHWTATSRDYTLNDYQTIANIGKNAGTRIMTAWILQDLDKTGVTASLKYNSPIYPSYISSWGLNWKKPDINKLNSLMNFVKNNAAYMEFGLHGVSHEYYYYDKSEKKIKSTRDEWADRSSLVAGTSLPRDMRYLKNKLDCALDIIRQYFDKETCSFPKSFVPPGHGYYYGNNSSNSTGSLFRQYGVKYANGGVGVSTSIKKGTIDHGLIFIDRAYGANYNAEGVTPWEGDYNSFDYPYYPTDAYGWVESHFPNLWGAEQKWTEYLLGLNNSPDRFLPNNTAQCSSQWLYRNYAKINMTGSTAIIDTRLIPDDAYSSNLLSTLVLKTRLNGKHISSASIDNDGEIVGYYEDKWGYGYLIIGHKTNPMGRLSKGIYTVKCEIGDKFMDSYVDMTKSTYSLYSFSSGSDSASIKLEMYGTQEVNVKLPFEPKEVKSDNPSLIVKSWSYSAPFLRMNVSGRNIQGEFGTISIFGKLNVKK